MLSLLSCGREVTGPANGTRIATGLSFVAEFPGALANLEQGAGDIVPFNRVRVLFARADESIALDQTFPFGGATDSLPLALSLPLAASAPPDGEDFALYLRYINAGGDTVFSGGPVAVRAVPRRSGDPLPPPALVPLQYTGPGAEAVTIALSPDTLPIIAGDAFAFTTLPRDAQGTLVSSAPVIFSALDPAKAPITEATAPSGVSLATRGTARIRAVLAANGAVAEAVLLIAPKPAALQRLGLTALSGVTNGILADSVVLRLLATDGGPIENAVVTVTIEGGGGANDTTLITDANGRAAVQWTLGSAVGVAAQRLKFNANGVGELVVSANVTAPVLTATQLVITQQITSPAVSFLPFTPPLIVEVRNSNNELVPSYTGGVLVNFATGPVGGAVIGVAFVQAVNGVATFSSLTANLVGAYRFEVASGSLIPDTTDVFTIVAGAPANIALVSGGGQTAPASTPLLAPITVRVTDAATNPVANAPVTFAVTAGGGSLLGAATVTDTLGRATLGGWTLGAATGTQSITATVAGVAPLQINASTPAIIVSTTSMSSTNSLALGLQRTGILTLSAPAPAGGATIVMKSSRTGFALLSAFPDSLGRADSAVVVVSEGATQTNFTVQVLESAPLDTFSVLFISTSNGNFTAPALVTQPILEVVADLSSSGTTLSPDDPFRVLIGAPNGPTGTIVIFDDVLRFGGPGKAITVYTDSGQVGNFVTTAAVNDTVTVTIPAGAKFSPSTVAEGGIAFRYLGAGTAFVLAQAPNARLVNGRVVNVTEPSIAAFSGFGIGTGLQRQTSLILGTPAPAGGTAITIKANIQGRILFAPNTTTVGADSIVVVVPEGSQVANVVVQALNVLSDTIVVTASSPGLVSKTANFFVWTPVADFILIQTATTALAADDAFIVRVGSPSTPTGTSLASTDGPRFGTPPLQVTVVSSNGTVGRLVTSALVADTVVMQIAPGQNSTASTVAAGGIAIRPLAAGTTVISATIPGVTQSVSTAGTTVTVNP